MKFIDEHGVKDYSSYISNTYNYFYIHSSRGTVVCNLHFILKPTVIGHLAAVVLEFITFIGFIVGYLV